MSRDVESYDPLKQEDPAEVEEKELKLTFARTTIGVTMRAGGTCKVEESVYGAAIVMPQLARTTGWDKTMTILAIRSWMFLVLNIILQAYLLKMIAKEQSVIDSFGGQMSLCDFAANLDQCPGPGCRGPGGTDVTASRLYGWDAIVDRNFVKDSLKAVFPEKIQDIDANVDVGEYGLESYWCRLACCFIYMIPCMSEIVVILKMVELLYHLPAKAEPWIRPKSTPNTTGAMDEVTFCIAGMPVYWKVVTFMGVVFPKFMLWKLAAETGITFLMETAAIDDLIMNSVGLAFILGLDELIGSALMSEETIRFVSATEDYELFDATTSCVGDMSVLSEDDILRKHSEAQSIRTWNFWDTCALVPTKLVAALLLTLLFVSEYYWKHCTIVEDDGVSRLVSKPMYLPTSVSFSWSNAFLPAFFKPAKESEPFWKMPTGE